MEGAETVGGTYSMKEETIFNFLKKLRIVVRVNNEVITHARKGAG